MRIAFVSHSRRKVGGTEVYLDSVLPALFRSGHSVAWLYEQDTPGPALISCPDGVVSWCTSEAGVSQSLQKLNQWKPDIIFTHGLLDADFEAAVIGIAPSVLYVHNYYGTCISGDKLHSTAIPQICERRFGPACLLHYFPDHCGGRNPLTMWSQYRLQSRRLELMHRYNALITNSQYLVRELARHNLRAECVYPFTSIEAKTRIVPPTLESDPLRLIFAGRMSSLKGGKYLLNAAAIAQHALERNLHVTLAGDGPERRDWQFTAHQLQDENLRFEFPGWLSARDLQSSIARSHLHVLPSIWPEPFGLSGLEAGLFGVPTVAFAVGGIPEWLLEGVNGHLAPTPSTSEGLAAAIAKALSNPEHYQQLRLGASCEAQRYPLADHIAHLTAIFETSSQSSSRTR
jgi:glycosyltransferase involved in cell wall biosynthesis